MSTMKTDSGLRVRRDLGGPERFFQAQCVYTLVIIAVAPAESRVARRLVKCDGAGIVGADFKPHEPAAAPPRARLRRGHELARDAAPLELPADGDRIEPAAPRTLPVIHQRAAGDFAIDIGDDQRSISAR